MPRISKKERQELTTSPPLWFLFARVLGHDDNLFMDSEELEPLRYAFHIDWVRPLIDQGYLRVVSVERSWPPEQDAEQAPRKPYNYHKLETTESGIAWWAAERVKVYEERVKELVKDGRYGTDGYQFDLCKLVEPDATGDRGMVVGKGIGSELRFSHFDYNRFPLVFLGLREGLFKFERYYAYSRQWEETVTVTLTERGMRYFDSLPRLELQLECG